MHVPLSPETPLREAVVKYLVNALKRAKKLESSVMAMEKGSHLHDYRVLIRKARVIVGEFKKVFPEKTKSNLMADLAEIGNLTNPSRDFEVYARRRQLYSKMLPPNLKKGLDGFFKGIESKCVEERKRLSKELGEPPYSEIIDHWLEDLSRMSPVSKESQPQIESVGDAVLAILPKRLSKLRDELAELGKSAEVECIRELRARCKKTRYVVEFFTPLLPVQESQMLEGFLSSLQDKLGELSDLSVQIAFLEKTLDDIFTGDEYITAQTCAAVGAVFAQLRIRRNRARRELKEFRALSVDVVMN